MILLVACGVILAGVWGLKNPFAGLIGFLATTIIQPGELYPLYNTLHVERILAVVVMVSMLIHGGRLKLVAPTRQLLWFYAACVATIPLSFWVSNSISCAIFLGKLVIFHLLIANLVNTRQRMRIFLLAWAMLVTYLAVTSLVNYVHGDFMFRMDVDRAVGLTSASDNPDTLGLTIVCNLPILFLFLRQGERLTLRLGILAMTATCMVALLLTGSRGSVLTCAFITIVAILASRRVWLLPATAVAMLTIWLVLPMQYKARYLTVDHLKNDESYQNRLISWEGGWHMFLSNPVTGVGIGNYAFANLAKFWPGRKKILLDAHSLYFKLLGELGLAGTITFFLFIYAFYRTNRELRQRILAQEGDAAPGWWLGYPAAANLIILGLLYCGYAYHDVYRDTWYTLAGVTAGMALIVAAESPAEPANAAVPAAAELETWRVPA